MEAFTNEMFNCSERQPILSPWMAGNLWGQAMNGRKLVELIWGGDMELREADSMSPLARLLDAFLVVPTITLVANAGLHRPVAMAEGDELMAGASLGDILAEELGIHIPSDAIVLIEPAAMADATEVSGTDLGRELGNILLSMAASPQRAAERHLERSLMADEVSGRYSAQVARHGLASKHRQRSARV
jgi:hypothetical protein